MLLGLLGDARLVEVGRVGQRREDDVAAVQFVITSGLDRGDQIADAGARLP